MLTYKSNLLALKTSSENFSRVCAYVVAQSLVIDRNSFLIMRIFAVAICNSTVVSLANILNHLTNIDIFSLFV
jgi:hypothetical protein